MNINSALNIVLNNVINKKFEYLEHENKIIKKQLDAINDRASCQYYVYKILKLDGHYKYTDYNYDEETKNEFELASNLRSDQNIWHVGFYDAMVCYSNLCLNITEDNESFNEKYDDTMTFDDMLYDILLSFDEGYIGNVELRKDETDYDINPLCNVLNKPTNIVLKNLLHENREMKLRLNALRDVCENSENWYFNLVWYARGPNRILDDHVLNYFGSHKERLMEETEKIYSDNNYSHGFNSGMLAASRQFGDMVTSAQMVDEFYKCEDTLGNIDNFIKGVVDIFPILDT